MALLCRCANAAAGKVHILLIIGIEKENLCIIYVKFDAITSILAAAVLGGWVNQTRATAAVAGMQQATSLLHAQLLHARLSNTHMTDQSRSSPQCYCDLARFSLLRLNFWLLIVLLLFLTGLVLIGCISLNQCYLLVSSTLV
jgi:hypothetical protein